MGKCHKWSPQGSVLGPILFILFVNSISEEVDGDILLFADDTKPYKIIDTDEDQLAMQEDINNLHRWSQAWLMTFNKEKCKPRGCASRSPEASQTQLGRVKAICDLARLASGIIVVISDFNSLLNIVFSFVYGMARTHGVLLCVRHYTHTLSDT